MEMVGAEWRALKEEIARWRDGGKLVEFWWRDDDASRPDPALCRLLKLASDSNVPLALAVVPSMAEHSIFEGLRSEVAVLQHGMDHRNRAPATEKKSEFPPGEPIEQALGRLVGGRRKLEGMAGRLAIPVLAPPWNRISPALVPMLVAAGYGGLSTFGVRKVTNSAPGLTTVNTHVDIIDWKSTRGFCGADLALRRAVQHLESRRLGGADALEPTGWLTHHAVHDEDCWAFLEGLFEATRKIDGVRWSSPAALFSGRGGSFAERQAQGT